MTKKQKLLIKRAMFIEEKIKILKTEIQLLEIEQKNISGELFEDLPKIKSMGENNAKC